MVAMEREMKRTSLARATAAIIVGLMLLAPVASRAQALGEQLDTSVNCHLAVRSEEAAELVTAYPLKCPDAAAGSLTEALGRGAAMNLVATVMSVADRSGAVAGNAALLFSSRHQVTLGNPQGDVTLVEFFDYNCGFCKRALADMLALINDDPKLKVVLKELPVLGPGSTEAARVAVAVRMEDPSGRKYFGFHQQLLSGRGPVDKERALMAALDQGLNLASLERDMASDEVRATIAENLKLATAVGISGTPGYVIGNNVVVGAVGVTALKARVAAARGQRTY